MYVNDIIIIDDDTQGIADLKCYLQKHFRTKNIDSLRYFLGIVVARFMRGITLLQRKYVPDVLFETGILGCRAADTP